MTSAAITAEIRRQLIDEPVDLRNAEAAAPAPVAGGGGLVLKQTAHLIFGREGAGKSSVALLLATSMVVAGERVLYLDRENIPGLTRKRYEAIVDAHGWPDVLQSGDLIHRTWPTFELWPGEAVAAALSDLGITGVVFDSVRELFSQLQLDPDRDFSKLMAHFVTPLLQAGMWVLLLDNVGHGDPARPKGDSAKGHGITELYRITTVSPFSEAQRGRLDLDCTRSRSAIPGRRWSMTIGGGAFDLPVAVVDKANARAGAGTIDKDGERRARIMGYLLEHGPVSRNDVLRQVGGRRQAVLDAISGLVEAGVVHETSEGLLPVPTASGTTAEPPSQRPDEAPVALTSRSDAEEAVPVPAAPSPVGRGGGNRSADDGSDVHQVLREPPEPPREPPNVVTTVDPFDPRGDFA